VSHGLHDNDEEYDSGSGDESSTTDQGSHAKGQTDELNHRAELDVKDILQYLEETQLRWFRHVKRMPTGRTPLRWLKWKPSTTCPSGHQRKRWMDIVKKAVEKRGTTL